MKRFFDLTFRPFFLVTGAGTALVSLHAFLPKWAAEALQKLSFVQEYTIIQQHWGIMVGLMGVFMMVAAFRIDWRKPILIYSATEKAFMVYLFVTYFGEPFSAGFWPAAVVDASVVLYTAAYLQVCGFATAVK